MMHVWNQYEGVTNPLLAQEENIVKVKISQELKGKRAD
jgi:hypothetical protein